MVSNLQVWALMVAIHKKTNIEPCVNELTLATNFGNHAQMVTKFDGQILATKFVFIFLPDC